MNVFHYGHQDVVGLECTCRQQPLAHRGPSKEKVWGESAQGAWASCDAMEGVGPRKGFRARWQARSAASERDTPDLDDEGADAWEKIGFDFAETPRLRSWRRLGMRKEPSGSWKLSTRGFDMQWSM